MPKYTTIKCWNIPDALTDPQIVTASSPSLFLIKKSILKLGYRAFAVEEREKIEKQEWFTRFLLGDEVRFYIDGSGVYKLINCDLTENELYFERLNIPVGHKPWVFYSWQSDYNPSRSAIKTAAAETIKYINDNMSPRQTLELLESTRPEDGAKDIVDAIRNNIDKCMFAVFDITNIAPVFSINNTGTAEASHKAKEDLKCYPNANVVFELSYALARKRPDQILLVKRNRADDFLYDRVPFDFEHNRRIEYTDSSKITKTLRNILVDYFRRVNYIKID